MLRGKPRHFDQQDSAAAQRLTKPKEIWMGRPTPQSLGKRKREQMKQQKRRAKEEKRAARKAAKQSGSADTAAE